MRIVSLYRGAKVRLGILLNETILDATTAANTLGDDETCHFRDAIFFIRGGQAAMIAADKLIKQTPNERLLSRMWSNLQRRLCRLLFSAPGAIIESTTRKNWLTDKRQRAGIFPEDERLCRRPR